MLEAFIKTTSLEANDRSSSSSSSSNEGEGDGGQGAPALQFLTADKQLLGARLRALFFSQSQQSQQSQQGAQAQPPPTVGMADDTSGPALAALLETGECQPLFLFVKGKQVVGAVRGVSTPAILQLVQQHVGGGGGGTGAGPGAA